MGRDRCNTMWQCKVIPRTYLEINKFILQCCAIFGQMQKWFPFPAIKQILCISWLLKKLYAFLASADMFCISLLLQKCFLYPGLCKTVLHFLDNSEMLCISWLVQICNLSTQPCSVLVQLHQYFINPLSLRQAFNINLR